MYYKRTFESLKKHPIINTSVFLIILMLGLSVFIGLRSLNAYKDKFYPNSCIKEIRNLNKYFEEIFRIVATKMELEINLNIPKPIILMDNQISLLKFSKYLDWDCTEMIPYYFHKINMIVIPRDFKLDSLAHEYVHYFQVMYQEDDFETKNSMMADAREGEALFIQRWFRAKFIKHHLIQKSETSNHDLLIGLWLETNKYNYVFF